jgi:excisionase family DNA binding protein
MTITEAAKYMEVSHWTIRRWIRQRLFPVTKINSRVIRIKRDDLEAFRNKHRVNEW